MKRLILCLIPLLFFGGCSKYDVYSVSDIYRGRGLYCECEILAKHDLDYRFLVSYACDAQTDRAVVLEPEQIAGLTYDFTRGELGVGDTFLATPLPHVPGYTPCDCLRGVFSAIADKAPSSFELSKKNKRETVTLTFEDVDGVHSMSVTLERKTGRFISALFYQSGALILEARARVFYFTEEKTG